ncbi:MAG: carboxypeptidase M32 [Thermoleophilia bacterium]|nr:carboxypeptidase M32 [Thermoleophilia bacterium]
MVSNTSTEPISDELVALRGVAEELKAIGGAVSLLAWDERTMLPEQGNVGRARQMAVMSGLYHDRATSDSVNRAIAAVEDQDPTNIEAKVLRREFDVATKLPTEFVSKFAEARSLSEHAWKGARERNDFAGFAPQIETLVEYSRERAELLGYETEAYDALHDLFEHGSHASVLERMFDGLRGPLRALIEQQPAPDESVLKRSYDVGVQEQMGRAIIEMLGFDLTAGRLDPTTHPFCQTVGGGDVRLTTRYDQNWLPGSLFSTIHEAGHGIYEQAFHRLALPPTIADAPGLGTHESQSRMFENIIGRGRPFWQFAYPQLQAAFPAALGDVDLGAFVAAINVSQTSLIRVEADELTYNLHIAARFELERAMINGTLKVNDLPEAWNDAYDRWVGIRPTDDKDGCLQDVHWAAGMFGYFPTYTLGNVYSAQFMAQLRTDMPDLDSQLASGDVLSMRNWFDEKVYRHGSTKTGAELVQHVTGGGVDSAPLVAYLTQRFG